MTAQPPSECEKVPQGYRQALLTGVGVMLAFSFAYLKFLVIDPESGCWTLLGVIAAAFAFLALGFHLHVLWRGLQVQDDYRDVYAVTVRRFGWGIWALVASAAVLLIAFNLETVLRAA